MNMKSGNLFAVALLIFLFTVTAKAEIFTAYLNGAQQVPAAATSATGYARVDLNEGAGTITFTVVFNGLTSAQTLSHIHAPAPIGANASVIIDFGTVGGTSGTISGTRSITPTQIAQLRAHQGYVNVHSVNFPNGEIRGQLGVERPVDADGDGRTDPQVLRFPTGPPSPISVHTLGSTAGYTVLANFGDAQTDFPAPGDYDGDAKTDIALYRAGIGAGADSYFIVMKSSDNTVDVRRWGITGDQACARDFDGDGKTDPAIFRRGAVAGDQARFYIYQSSNNQQRVAFFGTTGDGTTTGDTPVVGDYDGDGKFDPAVYRFGGLVPNNTFIILRSSDGLVQYQAWGDFQTDYICPGDYDGDGKTDFMAARTGGLATTPVDWWLLQSSNGATVVRRFGISSDLPVQGDYDGDARTDIAMYRRGATTTSVSTFWVFNSFTATGTGTIWGLRPDFPVATFDAR